MARNDDRHTEDSGMFDMDSSQHGGRSLSRLGSELVPEIFSNEQVIRLVALISHHTSTEDQVELINTSLTFSETYPVPNM